MNTSVDQNGNRMAAVILLLHLGWMVSAFQFSSVTQSCLTLCDPMDCSTPAFPVHHHSWSLPKLMSIESVMPSSHLIAAVAAAAKRFSHVRLRPHGLQPTRLLRPWDFPGTSTGVGCHCLLQTSRIFPCNKVKHHISSNSTSYPY